MCCNLFGFSAGHEGSTEVKIVIINVDNKIRITFDTQPGVVDENLPYIVDQFNTYFDGWKFNIDDTSPIDSSTGSKAEDQTLVNCHFLDKETYEPIPKSTAQV